MAAADSDVEDTATSSSSGSESAGESGAHAGAAADDGSITSGRQQERAVPAAFHSGFSFGPRPATSVDRACFWA
jgi:hypothetical protein